MAAFLDLIRRRYLALFSSAEGDPAPDERTREPARVVRTNCPACSGTGFWRRPADESQPCMHCGGTGYYTSQHPD